MIEILNYTAFSKGSIIGYVDVKYKHGDLEFLIKHILHMQKGDSKWFMYPKFCVEGTDPKQWVPYFQFSFEHVNKQFFQSLEKALDTYLNQSKSEDLPF